MIMGGPLILVQKWMLNPYQYVWTIAHYKFSWFFPSDGA